MRCGSVLLIRTSVLPFHCEVYVGVLVVDEIKENGGIMFRAVKKAKCVVNVATIK